MGKDFSFSLPTLGIDVPCTPNWIHEVKHDGYRLRVVRNGKSVRLLTRNGADWTHRYSWIQETALKIKSDQYIIDGEAVVLDLRGHSDFDALHSRRFDNEVQLYAFDIVAQGGNDLTSLPLTMRKTNLQRLLRGRMEGIHTAPFEAGEIGPDLFRQACLLGLEGIVSKQMDRSYKQGRCSHWIKSKNRAHPAFTRVMDAHI